MSARKSSDGLWHLRPISRMNGISYGWLPTRISMFPRDGQASIVTTVSGASGGPFFTREGSYCIINHGRCHYADFDQSQCWSMLFTPANLSAHVGPISSNQLMQRISARHIQPPPEFELCLKYQRTPWIPPGLFGSQRINIG